MLVLWSLRWVTALSHQHPDAGFVNSEGPVKQQLSEAAMQEVCDSKGAAWIQLLKVDIPKTGQ